MSRVAGSGEAAASPRSSTAAMALPGVFFGLFFLYIWLWVGTPLLCVDPTLLPHDAGLVPFPGLACTISSVKSFLSYPGGPAECLAALLSQTYYHPWAGALAVTIVAAGLGLATGVCIPAVAGASFPGVRFVPAMFVLALYSRYADKLPMLLGVLVALAGALLYTRLRGGHWALRVTALLVMCALVYYVAGGAYVLCTLLCAVAELRGGRKPILGLCYPLLGAAVPYALGVLALDLSPPKAYARLSPLPLGVDRTGQGVVLGLYLCIAVSAFACWAWHRRIGGARRPLALDSPAVGFSLALVAAVLVVSLSFDSTLRSLRRINHYAAEGMWVDLLQEAQGLRRDRYTYAVMHAVNRALYETGRLPYDMFSYPQHPRSILVGVSRGSWPTEFFYEGRRKQFFEVGDIELQIGLVNSAEHEAYEALELFPDHPVVMQRLALIHMVKGQPEVAQVFLHALCRRPHYRHWAQETLRRLESDPLCPANPDIQRIRALMVRRHSAILDLTVDQRLDELLNTNRHNRMAFEYKMANCLLTCRFSTFIRELPRLDDFGYPDIPRHYEEAILIYEDMTGEQVDLGGRQIRPETRAAFQEFRSMLLAFRHADDRQAAWSALEARFGHTYFYYNARIAVAGLS